MALYMNVDMKTSMGIPITITIMPIIPRAPIPPNSGMVLVLMAERAAPCRININMGAIINIMMKVKIV